MKYPLARRDSCQAKIWRENHQKIMKCLKDGKLRSVTDMHRATGISRNSLYDHLPVLQALHQIIREGLGYRSVHWAERVEKILPESNPRWNITRENTIVLKNGICVELEEPRLAYENLENLSNQERKLLQIGANRKLEEKILCAAGLLKDRANSIDSTI